MCCVPVRIQGSDQPFAVLQAINKDQLACFSAEDEVNMKVSPPTHVLRSAAVTLVWRHLMRTSSPAATCDQHTHMQVYSKQLGIVLQDFGACAGGRMFAAIDVDNSGFISLDELRGAMRAENPSVTEAQVLKP